MIQMSKIDETVKKRSKRMVKLFNSLNGHPIGDFPGPIPPFSKWLNGIILHAKRGEIELEFQLRPEMANPTGLLHGGVHSAMMDDAIGMCTGTLGYEGFLITINFSINFLGKVKVDEKVRVKAKIVREGRNIVNARCDIYDMNGKIISSGQANLLKTQYTPDYVKTIDSIKNIDDLTNGS